MRVVIAPDSFKGSISAAAAAAALAAGWRMVRPLDEVILRPMADGGEGTVAVIAAARGASRRIVTVTGPTRELVDAHWMRDGGTGIVELAESSGLELLETPEPWDAGTVGFGQTIAAAMDDGVDSLLLAIGGSASTDGGAGMLTALDARLLDGLGRPIVPGIRGLLTLEQVDLSGMRPLPGGGVTALSDVDNPAIGPRGAAAVFGPQKGLDVDDVPIVDSAIARFAELLGVDPTEPGTGAAGATGLALRAWGASTRSGAKAVADAIGLPSVLREADLVVTGEGRLDEQTASGKVVEQVRRLGEAAGVPVIAVAGSVRGEHEGFAAVFDLVSIAGSVGAAMHDPAGSIRDAAARAASTLLDSSS
jgi:glycerate kinase